MTEHDVKQPSYPAEQPLYPAEKARQGDIILRTRARRGIFIAGFVGIVIIAIVLAYWR